MLTITNPATEEVIRELDADTATSIVDKYNAARLAQKEWMRTSFAERSAIILRFKQQLEERIDELAAILTSEMGKPLSQAQGEIRNTPQRIEFFLNETEAFLQAECVSEQGHQSEWIAYEPLGVLANISAWNYPYFVGVNVFIPALLTGNAVLYKPSEHATLTGLAIAEMFEQAGLPQGLFTPVIGGGEVGALLLEQPIQGVFFTGSYATGQKVAEAAAKKLIPVQLELGGKDPVYVCEDVNVASTAAAVADGAFYNAGQSCCGVERIYVKSSIYDAFVEAFAQTVSTFVTGDPTQDGTYLGPLFRASQLDHLERQVNDATSKGAHVLCGGTRLEQTGHFFAPTVLTQVNHNMDVMQEESFGPIIGIQSVKDDEEALHLMNDTSYGLTASVYTQDAERAQRILENVNAGTVYWNCCDRVSPRLPWSGRQNSGLGVTLSHLGIRPFLQPKAWHKVAPQS